MKQFFFSTDLINCNNNVSWGFQEGSDLELWDPELNGCLIRHHLFYMSMFAQMPCRFLQVSHILVAEKPQGTNETYRIQLRQSAIAFYLHAAVCRSNHWGVGVNREGMLQGMEVVW